MIPYLIQVIVYTGAMLLLYHLLLRDKPLHRFNRLYLLSAVILPTILPLLKLPRPLRPHQEGTPLVTMLEEVTIGAGDNAGAVPWWLLLIPLAYACVTLVVLCLKLVAYSGMRRVIRRSNAERRDGYTLLKHTGFGPGSWGQYIFLPGGDVDETIIRHERAHIQLRHSSDIIFISLVQALLWPNLFLHFIRKELVQVHEFQADAAVGLNGEEYTRLLLSSVFGTCTLPFTHSFIIHPIKRRIMMLHNNRKNGKFRGVLASILALSLLAGIVTMQSCEREKQQIKPLEGQDLAKLTKSPEYIGKGGLVNFMAENVVYPADAKEKGIEGKVMVKFVVDEQGKVKDAHVISKAVHPLLSQAALDAVSKMPDWQPGEIDGKPVPVCYILPVLFQLPEESNEPSTGNSAEKGAIKKKEQTSDQKILATFRFDARNRTPEEVVTALEVDGLEVQEITPGTDEHATQAQNARTAKLILASHNGFVMTGTDNE